MRRHFIWQARRYYAQVAGLLLLGSLFGIVMNLTVVLPAVLLGRAVDAALAASQASGAELVAVRRSLYAAAALYAGGMLLHGAARVGKRWYLRAALRRTVFTLRMDALRGMLASPLGWLRQQAVGDLMARVLGDTELFGSGFNESTTEVWDTWLFSLTLVGTMLAYDVRLTLLALAPVPIAFYLAYRLRNWVRGRSLATRRANSALTQALQEGLTGLRLLRLLGRVENSVERVDALSQQVAQASLAETRLQAGLQPVYTLLVSAGIVVIVWRGAGLVEAGTLTAGSLVGFVLLYVRFITRGFRLPLFFNRLQAAGVAWDRLSPLLPAEAAGAPDWRNSFRPLYLRPVPAPTEVAGPPSAALPVALEGVSFVYPGSGHPALQDVTLQVAPGEMVGVTGPIGSGKSALLRVLLGLYPVEQGSVQVGDRPVESWSESERARLLRYVPQEGGVFSGSVEENIGLRGGTGVFADQADLLRATSLDGDVAQWPAGLETEVGEGGVTVSGGQRQRIALAHALATESGQAPAVLLLDDPFAAVDVATERRIMAALRDAVGSGAPPEHRATLLLCSHRLASFPLMDRIIVLDGGRIVAQGSHEELLQQGGLYARIFRAQHALQAEPEELP
ncbi:MAG: ABC transporter ATP-binding protein [Anaerolineae bacterium]|nr:ABC transporter ATP-binding protein [Chloroflexota bacterium]